MCLNPRESRQTEGDKVLFFFIKKITLKFSSLIPVRSSYLSRSDAHRSAVLTPISYDSEVKNYSDAKSSEGIVSREGHAQFAF